MSKKLISYKDLKEKIGEENLVIYILIVVTLIMFLNGCATRQDISRRQETLLTDAMKLSEQEGKEQEAYQLYKEVLEDGDYALAYVGIAYIYAKINNYEKAIEYIDLGKRYISSEIEPNALAGMYFSIANIYQGMWSYEGEAWDEEAIDAFNQAAAVPGISEKNIAYYTYQAYKHIVEIAINKEGEEWLDTAIYGTEILVDMDENNAGDYIYRLADLYGQKGDFEKAEQYIQELQKMNAESTDMLFLQAKYYCYKGEYEKAKTYMDQLNEENCGDIRKYYLLQAFYASKIGNQLGVKENIENLLEQNINALNQGIVKQILRESNVEIDAKYAQILEEEKQIKYAQYFEDKIKN